MIERYRDCYECGLRQQVTMLSQGRAYRCSACGAVCRHDRDTTIDEDAPHRTATPFMPRLLIGTLLVGGVGMGLWFFLGKQWPLNLALSVSGASSVFFIFIALFLRTLSRDAAGFVAGFMISLALAALAITFTVEQLEQRALNSLMLIMLAFGGLGGMQLARWYRNRRALPSFGEQGLVIEPHGLDDEAEQNAEPDDGPDDTGFGDFD